MAESKLTTYEECRKRRLEENKKRMEELNLTKLSHSLKPSKTHKPYLVQKRVSKQQVEQRRRSIRVANKPPPNYTNRNPNRVHTIQRADQLQAGLDSRYPSFVKSLLPTHVSGSSELHIPTQFCKNHLPPYNETITLVDEEGNEFSTKYFAKRNKLSSGWIGFSVDHELVDGEALVFHLVKPTTFKVHIIRAYKSEENDKNEYDKDKNEDSDVAYLSRSAKRIRASRK